VAQASRQLEGRAVGGTRWQPWSLWQEQRFSDLSAFAGNEGFGGFWRENSNRDSNSYALGNPHSNQKFYRHSFFFFSTMTTAHRPTWKAAVGKANEGGWSAGGAISTATSALDAPAHTKLKLRTGSQVVDRQQALKESLQALEEAERTHVKIGKRPIDPAEEEKSKLKLLKQTAEVDEEKIRKKYDDSDIEGHGDDESDLDASDSSDGDSEDDEAALQAELAKIRAEREEARRKEAEKEAAEEEGKLEEAALLGNPLLAAGGLTEGRMKRKWNDDVVFRGQAKNEPKVEKRFINDTIRNDFHKRFLNKFIR